MSEIYDTSEKVTFPKEGIRPENYNIDTHNNWFSDCIDVKLCQKCNMVKTMDSYYKRSNSMVYKYCKKCHNGTRNSYNKSKKKTSEGKKLRGFYGLELHIQQDILKDIHLKFTYKTISEKYNIPYSSLCSWKRKGLPKYIDVCNFYRTLDHNINYTEEEMLKQIRDLSVN